MDTNTIVKQAIEAIKQGNKSNARTLLETVIKNEPNNEEAWFLLAHVAQTQEQARIYLGRVISINPNNERAKQQLEKLNATPSNKQTAPQPVKVKESKAVLYTLLGGIIMLLLAVIFALAGIWLKNDNQPINMTSPTSIPQTGTSSTIPKWEYMQITVNCLVEGQNPCFIGLDDSRKYPNSISILNELGQQGWDVIYINPMSQYGLSVEFVLKRPVIGQ